MTKQSNRRKDPRVQVNEKATIWLPDIRKTLDCVIKDVSESGVRLSFEDINLVPGSFRLNVPRLNFKTDCIVVWRAKHEVGVIFEAPPRL